jgi:type I restriction enzyme S subunit
MRTHEAASALVSGAPWPVVPFRRVAQPVRQPNADARSVPLSVSSQGYLYERPVEGEGAQATSDETLRRNWLVEPGDIVVNPMWLVGGGLALSARGGCVSPDYRVYRCDELVEPRFLAYLLRTPQYIDQYALYTRGDTTFDRRVSRFDFEDLPVLRPDLPTQRRIADWLDGETRRIGRVLEASEMQLRLAEEVLSAEVATVLRVGENDPFTPLPGPVPAGYIPLWLAARTFSGKTLQTQQAKEEEVETPYLKASNIGYEGVDLGTVDAMWATPSERAELRIREGDVFVIEGGATAGKAAQLDQEPAGLTILQNHVHCVRTVDGFNQRFMYWVLRAYYGSGWYPVITAAVTFGSFPATKLRALPVPNVGPDEQEAIVARLDERLATVHAVRERTERFRQLLNERKQALITAAVTGEIRV